jgi:PKD repeat protein
MYGESMIQMKRLMIFLIMVLVALAGVASAEVNLTKANFIASPMYGMAPLTVQFTDLSTGTNVSYWRWDFENDGIPDSYVQHPVQTYPLPGRYSVFLWVWGVGGNGTLLKENYILVYAAPPIADFSASPTSGTAPLTVQFTDRSTGDNITSWAWDFNNDGTTDSTQHNPSYTYTASGTCTVRLTVRGDGGIDSEVKSGYIAVSAALPVAQFSGSPTSGRRPLTVRFTDQSTGEGITSWAWDFNNDGKTDSTLENPTYIYSKRGFYSVRLTVVNSAGTDTEVKLNYINVK